MAGFEPLSLTDKARFDLFYQEDPPVISECTFTNLYIWRRRYRPLWCQWEGCLLTVLRPVDANPFGLPPVGRGDKLRALEFLCARLKECFSEARVSRVPKEFVEKYVDPRHYEVVPDRDQSDYVYLAEDLIGLAGRKYHRKKNHLKRFLRSYSFQYRTLDVELVECFLEMQENWCQIRDCEKDPDLLAEDYAVYQALTHFGELGYQGGAIVMDGKVEAFSLGQLLNPDTAVIHIEKANPKIPGLYTAMNQFFCSKAWPHVKFINREQDLGIAGLRRAKTSYHPHHMVDKYTLIPR